MAIRPLIAGNWKMNLTVPDAVALASALAGYMKDARGFDMAICPPSVLIPPVASALAGAAVLLGGQDCHTASSGAHTGDISADMLAAAGCQAVIVGHSERRADHGEADSVVKAKAVAAHTAGLIAIICVGETEAQRLAGEADAVVAGQLAGSIPDGATAANTVIAYEPVWAIGTGRTPTEDDIVAMHTHIRGCVAGVIADGGSARLLYGGSVKPGNAAAILALDNVNGALVGGASLKVEDFTGICAAL